MSITDELREWAKALTHWWYDPVKDQYTYTTGTMPPSIDAIRLDSIILAIADRIDAEHERAMADAYLSGTPTDEKLTELGWIRLPKDADGEYIHVGDVMEWVSYDEDYRPVIRTVNSVGEQVFFAWSKENGRYAQYEACAYRHYHAPTVEDVLREFTDAILEWSGKSGTVAEVGTWSDIAADYAAKLRLADGEDA